MKKKINLLIIASILGLISLSVIQGYLINNTYKLKKDAFIGEARKSISRIDDFSPELDSITDQWQDYFLNQLIEYKIGKVRTEDALKNLKLKIDSSNTDYIVQYQKELKKSNIAYDLKFQKKVTTVILLDSVKNDTIFDYKKHPNSIIVGDLFEEEDGHTISNSLWLTDHTSDRNIDGENVSVSFDLQFGIKDIINIDGWEKIVLKQMTGLLALSLLIFSFVIAILYYSIKSLISQKKIADVKTDFINNITHELKTPLATLSLATKMLKKDVIQSNPEATNTTVDTINRQSTRLQKLIDQVLNNSLGYNEIQINKEQVKVEDYMNTILDDFSLSVKDKNVKVNRDVLKSNQTIPIDKFYLTTALFNVLENAVKYNGDNITIDCKTLLNDYFVISIADNGIGVSEKHQKQLFDKFYRAGNTEVHNVKGLGLGLYYTNQIIKAHQGNITIKSSEGEGSTFTIRLPLN